MAESDGEMVSAFWHDWGRRALVRFRWAFGWQEPNQQLPTKVMASLAPSGFQSARLRSAIRFTLLSLCRRVQALCILFPVSSLALAAPLHLSHHQPAQPSPFPTRTNCSRAVDAVGLEERAKELHQSPVLSVYRHSPPRKAAAGRTQFTPTYRSAIPEVPQLR